MASGRCPGTISFPRVNGQQARYSNAETHVFEDGAHTTLMLYPDAYNAVLRGFLKTAFRTFSAYT